MNQKQIILVVKREYLQSTLVATLIGIPYTGCRCLSFHLIHKKLCNPVFRGLKLNVWLKFALKKCDKTSNVLIVLPLLQLKNARVT